MRNETTIQRLSRMIAEREGSTIQEVQRKSNKRRMVDIKRSIVHVLIHRGYDYSDIASMIGCRRCNIYHYIKTNAEIAEMDKTFDSKLKELTLWIDWQF